MELLLDMDIIMDSVKGATKVILSMVESEG